MVDSAPDAARLAVDGWMSTGKRYCLACGQRVWTRRLLHQRPTEHDPDCMVVHDIDTDCLTEADLEERRG